MSALTLLNEIRARRKLKDNTEMVNTHFSAAVVLFADLVKVAEVLDSGVASGTVLGAELFL